MRGVLIALLVSLPSWAIAGSEAQVQARQLGDGVIELTVTLPATTDVTAAQRALAPRASEACGEQGFEFGRFEFESVAPLVGREGAASLTLVQQVRCGKPKAGVAAAEKHDGPPGPADEALIRTLTLDHLSAKDRGDFDAADAMFAETTRAMLNQQDLRGPRTAFNAIAGVPTKRQVVAVTWYDDPSDAPVPGRYVAADYSAYYANGSFYCGYLMWLLQPDGSYRIVREEEGQMDANLAGKVPADQMASVRAQLQCRD